MKRDSKGSTCATAIPIVAVTADVGGVGTSPGHTVKEKYIEAVAGGCGAFPFLLPAMVAGGEMKSLFERFDLDSMLDTIDGIFLTGNDSNIEAVHYGGEKSDDDDEGLDRQRDYSNIALIKRALTRKIPIFGLCRGLQEINVALGGTITRDLHRAGFLDHRAPPDLPREELYVDAHSLNLMPDGRFRKWLGADSIRVNSMHGQGLEKIADDLRVEAVAPDGLVEAVTHKDPGQCVIAVQWHPEWRYWNDPVSSRLFQCFGEAVRQRAAARRTGQKASRGRQS